MGVVKTALFLCAAPDRFDMSDQVKYNKSKFYIERDDQDEEIRI